MRNGCRVRQGGLGHVLCHRGGIVLDDNHRGLGSLCCSLGPSPKKEGVQSKASEIQDKTARIEELQVQQRILLFFFLVGAERGEVKVQLTSGARRRRSSFPWPLGGNSGGGLRRPHSGCRRGVRSGRSRSGGPGGPRSSCRSGVRCSRGNSACRGRACSVARRLLTRLPPRYVPGLAETPSWCSWGLHLRQAV